MKKSLTKLNIKIMKSIERRFSNISEKNPKWSSHTCFAEAVEEQGFSKQAISRWFNKLVEKDDYAREDKKAVLGFLISLANPVRKAEIESKSAPQRKQSAEWYISASCHKNPLN